MNQATELNSAQQEIVNWLTMLRRVLISNGIPEGFHYAGVGDFLLQHGVWYAPGMPRAHFGPPKACFPNSLLHGRRHGLRYVEGYAVPDLSIPLSMHHAWNIDRHGNVVDITWEKPGLAYLGVEFSLNRAEHCIVHSSGSVLDDCRARFPLYQKPWQGEDPTLKFKRSNVVRRLAKTAKTVI